ncbi:unnamed protein product [Peronospora farinosa]|uniref:Uncharacterized protein n=1 Tax=Peronospora farinosa TaxID=134698 RepID=A0AAV0STI4_9STRA|nr:unnamed protein product [Peronospora farinosa]
MHDEHGENEDPYGSARNIRHPPHISHESWKRFAEPEYNCYDYDKPRYEENSANFTANSETADVTNENARLNEASKGFLEQYHQSMDRRHSRRTRKRPLSKMQRDGAPPPTIYRHRIPYLYDYMVGDENNDWMTEDEEMDGGYGYPLHFRPIEVPVVRRGRRFESTNAQRWSSPAGRGPQQMYKRRQESQEDLALHSEMTDDIMFETRHREHVSSPPPNIRTVLVDSLDKVADNAGDGAFSDHTDTFAGNLGIVDEGPTPSSLSVAHTDNACQEFRQNDSVMNEVPSQLAVDELAAFNVIKEAESLTREMLSEKEDESANEQNFQLTSDNATADEHPVEHILQSEVVPLDSNASIQETIAFMSPQRSDAPTNIPTRESCVASSPSYVVKDTDHNTPGSAMNAMELSAESSEENQAVSVDPEVPLEKESPVPVPVVSEYSVLYDCSLNKEKPTVSTVDSIVTDTVRTNNHAIASLERLNEVEADYKSAKTLLLIQEDKLRQVKSSSKSCRRMEILCGIAYDLQWHVRSPSCGLNESRKQELLGKLGTYLEAILIRKEQTLQERADALQAGLEHFLAVDIPIVDNQVAEKKTEAVKLNSISNSNNMPLIQTDMHDDRPGDGNDRVWEDDDWFEEGAFDDPASESDEQEDVVAQIPSEKSNLKLGGDFLAVKMEEEASLRWPRELPPFLWSLLERVISSDPQSYVMRVTLKRLLDEIAKGDPYYYLHPTNASKNANVSSPLHSSPSPGCEFGCRGASALKWERKLVSQISSRMKSFDNVAYSLARSSGGKEVLNRKKMNSIIRKLHLVAMQLHSLVSHLYCVKGHVTCKEVDSLPVALNNSHFERKMGVYKSRLKLVVPHKYQQQTQQEQHSSNEPGEEILRDTYEFFPELLLCIDIWGYNYRESLGKQHNNNLISGKLAGSEAISETALFPLRYFRKVESLAFDFENDSNDLLHCVCDELLNIVCLWNDFKWTDNLEAVALDRVLSFEADVTASILKILELYAHHLQALWSPKELEYDCSLSVTNTRGVRESWGWSYLRLENFVQHVATEALEHRLAEEYWNRKVTALSNRNPGDDEMKVGSDFKLQLLSDEAICSWDQHTLISYLLRWSDVYAIRTEVNALSVVTNHMMKHEVQKFRFMGRDDTNVTSGSYVNKTMVDSSTRRLLAAVGRAQMLIQDAVIGSEKLALHSASNQLPNEKKQLKPLDFKGRTGNKTSSSSREAAPSCPNSTCINDAGAHSDDAVSETVFHAEAIASKDADSYDAIEDVNIDIGMTGEQPEVNDLIQLLVVTKQDMQELCGHRPRSARMREKVQMQSLQLARQTVEIFRNIRNMYGSQRR